MAHWARGITLLSLGLACEPVAPLGKYDVPGAHLGMDDEPTVAGGARGEVDDPRLIGGAGEGGLSDGSDDADLVQGHECSVSYPGESHVEPIAVCCVMSEEEKQWRDEAFVFVNETRIAQGVPPFEEDPALDEAAIAWAMHWSLHWSPSEKTGYPGRAYSPSEVASACGTTASLIMATDAQDEPILDTGWIDPRFPAEYWESDDNLRSPFLNPDYRRMGLALYDGLLVGVLGRESASR